MTDPKIPVVRAQVLVTPTSPTSGPLWRSRRFWTAVGSLVMALLVIALPDLSPYRDELFVLIAILGPALILGYSAEDVALARQMGKENLNIQDSLREILEAVIAEGLDARLPPSPPPDPVPDPVPDPSTPSASTSRYTHL